MGFGDAVKSVLGQYAEFNGRARRSEFWYWFLFDLIVAVVLSIIDAAAHTVILAIIVNLALIVANLSVGCRRLHDTGRSGWFQLIALIPIVGIIVLIVFWVQDSGPGQNQYGPSPKQAIGYA